MMNNSNVLVSIIVPVYNAEKFLVRCIESILDQSYRNIECILVDDGSIDDSANICDKFVQKDERIVCIHQKNSGVSAARNKGLDIAKGEYVCFVDSDDYVDLNMVEENLDIALEQQADIVCFNYFNVTKREKICSYTYKSRESLEDILLSFFSGSTEKACWNKLYKKDIWNRLRFPIDMSFAEDWYTVLQAFLIAEKIIGNDKAYYFYNVENESSIVHNINVRAEWFNFLCAEKQVELLKLKDTDLYNKLLIIAMRQAYKLALRVWRYDLRSSFLSNSEREKLQHFINSNIQYKNILNMRDKTFLFIEQILRIGSK